MKVIGRKIQINALPENMFRGKDSISTGAGNCDLFCWVKLPRTVTDDQDAQKDSQQVNPFAFDVVFSEKNGSYRKSN